MTQLTRFVLIGGFSALIDYGTYQLLLTLGLWVHLAKAVSFIVGTATAYWLNRRWTFKASTSRASAVKFAALYAVTFCVNVGINGLALQLLPASLFRVTVAFIIAQGTATVINFVMLRTVVFRERPGPGSTPA
jgi:putative flippase GtrA